VEKKQNSELLISGWPPQISLKGEPLPELSAALSILLIAIAFAIVALAIGRFRQQ
jgi:hypothetical protein